MAGHAHLEPVHIFSYSNEWPSLLHGVWVTGSGYKRWQDVAENKEPLFLVKGMQPV